MRPILTINRQGRLEMVGKERKIKNAMEAISEILRNKWLIIVIWRWRWSMLMMRIAACNGKVNWRSNTRAYT